MKLDGRRRSSNVEDRRGSGGGIGRRAMIGAPIGCGTLVIGAILIALGADPLQVLSALLDGGATSQMGPTSTPRPQSPRQDALADFSSAVLADTEDTWSALYRESGGRYQPPTLVLFTDAVRSACGTSTPPRCTAVARRTSDWPCVTSPYPNSRSPPRLAPIPIVHIATLPMTFAGP